MAPGTSTLRAPGVAPGRLGGDGVFQVLGGLPPIWRCCRRRAPRGRYAWTRSGACGLCGPGCFPAFLATAWRLPSGPRAPEAPAKRRSPTDIPHRRRLPWASERPARLRARHLQGPRQALRARASRFAFVPLFVCSASFPQLGALVLSSAPRGRSRASRAPAFARRLAQLRPRLPHLRAPRSWIEGWSGPPRCRPTSSARVTAGSVDTGHGGPGLPSIL